MEKVWLKHYQPGVPQVIDPAHYTSINHLFEEACQNFPNRPAFSNMNKTLTFKMLEEKSLAFASYLQNVLNLKKGERVALMMPNILQYPVALLGILQAGLIAVNVNPLYTPRELEHQLLDSGAETIVILANFATTLQQVLSQVNLKHVLVTEVGDLLSFPSSCVVNWVVKRFKKMVPPFQIPQHILFRDTLRVGKQYLFKKPIVQPNDIAFLQYTGGTTGITKAAMLTHRNMVANIEQAYAWIKPVIQPGYEIVITALPLYHIFSLTANCLTFMRVGGLNVLVSNPRDIGGFIKILQRYRFTAITGVNTLFNALLNHPQFAGLDFSALRLALGGGMSVQQAVAKRWKQVTGVPLIEAYGLTESSPAVCINPLNLRDFSGSIGLPVSSTDISIRDAAGLELNFNEAGELWVRGPQVMLGYWQMSEETKGVLEGDWLKTGDIAIVNEQGFVRIVDRKKDMILVSGFNVYPNEVEDVIALLKEVAEVAVIGVSYPGGERVKAFIVKKDQSLTSEVIMEHCRRELTPYKVPKEIEFRKILPKSPVGKILRRVLKAEDTEVQKRENDSKD